MKDTFKRVNDNSIVRSNRQEICKALGLPLNDNPVPDSTNFKHLLHLPLKLRYLGSDYIQVCRGGRSCINQQLFEGKTVGFEVFKIKQQPESLLYGKIIKAHERWPKNEDFGKTAWTCCTLDEARDRYNELEQ